MDVPLILLIRDAIVCIYRWLYFVEHGHLPPPDESSEESSENAPDEAPDGSPEDSSEEDFSLFSSTHEPCVYEERHPQSQ